jgi:hypothetical protein
MSAKDLLPIIKANAQELHVARDNMSAPTSSLLFMSLLCAGVLARRKLSIPRWNSSRPIRPRPPCRATADKPAGFTCPQDND